MRGSSLWSIVQDVFRVRKLRAMLDRREAELSEERSSVSHLRRALAGELTKTKIAEAISRAHRRAHEQLASAVGEIAMPALRKHEDESGPSLVALQDAFPEPVDEDEVRWDVLREEEWL